MAVPRAKKTKPNKDKKALEWFDKGFHTGYGKGCDEMGDLFMALFYTATKDECNLKADKVNKIIKRADRYAISLRDGTITYTDLRNDLIKSGVDMSSFRNLEGVI